MTARIFTLTLDIPTEWWMSSNHSLHRMAKAAKVANLRMLALRQCQLQHVVKGLERVRMVAYLTYPDRRHRDDNNASPVTKALVDGMVDHGVIADDNYRHCVGPDHRFDGVTKGKYTVRMVIEDLSGGTGE